MKKYFFLLLFFLSSFALWAQSPVDFYVSLHKAPTNDSLFVSVSVPLNMTIGNEVIEIAIKEKGAASSAAQKYKVSTRLSSGIVNNMNLYSYVVPFHSKNDKVYELVIHNKKICNVGVLKIEDEFSSEESHTFSYANRGYKLVNAVGKGNK